MLLVTNDDIETFLSMPECVATLEDAYRDFGNGDAVDIPRQDMLVSNDRQGAVHAFKTMSGSWPRAKVASSRFQQLNGSRVHTWLGKRNRPSARRTADVRQVLSARLSTVRGRHGRPRSDSTP